MNNQYHTSSISHNICGRWVAALALIFTLLLGATITPVAAATSTPSEVVSGFYAELVDTMKNGEKLGAVGRYKQLEPRALAAFDFALMTKLAVGAAWGRAASEEQQQAITAFSRFSIAMWASRFPRLDGEKFTVTGEQRAVVGNSIIVATTLQTKSGEAIVLNYLVRTDAANQPRIVDVLMDGTISELAIRRSEFAGVVGKDGLVGLSKALDEKTDKMLKMP